MIDIFGDFVFVLRFVILLFLGVTGVFVAVRVEWLLILAVNLN